MSGADTLPEAEGREQMFMMTYINPNIDYCFVMYNVFTYTLFT